MSSNPDIRRQIGTSPPGHSVEVARRGCIEKSSQLNLEDNCRKKNMHPCDTTSERIESSRLARLRPPRLISARIQHTATPP